MWQWLWLPAGVRLSGRSLTQRLWSDVMLRVEDALSQLAARRAQVIGRVRARVGSEADAEDIFQQALIRAAEHLGALGDPSKLNAWFDAIVRRLVLDHHAAVARREGHEVITEVMPEPAPEREVEVCGCSLRLIDAMRPEYAEIVRRVDLEEATVMEAADALGITANNASVRLHRARAALRLKLIETCGTTSARACMDCGCE
jgi:RNA polymerase sigma-70 factor (ECF subfamily)